MSVMYCPVFRFSISTMLALLAMKMAAVPMCLSTFFMMTTTGFF